MQRAWLAGALFCLPAPPGRAACAAATAADVPLRDSQGFLTVAASLDGRPVSLLVDTGSEGGLVTPDAASRLALPADPGATTRVQGTGGVAAFAPHVVLPPLRLGALVLPARSIPVGPLPALPRIDPPVIGLLGADVLARFDVEMDLVRGRLALYRVSDDCAAPLPPPFSVIELRRDGDRLTAPVLLDGHALEALLDTGALSVALDAETATRVLGVSPEALARDPGGLSGGVDMREVAFHWHRFGLLAVGPITTRAPVITVTPLHEDTPMLLGSSWFAGRRVWLSYTASRMFVSR